MFKYEDESNFRSFVTFAFSLLVENITDLSRRELWLSLEN